MKIALALDTTALRNLSVQAQAVNILLKYGTSPQVWYDPSDLVWNWRRNLLTYTEQFDNAAWTKLSTTVAANATAAPDGTTTADKLQETAATTYFLAESAALSAIGPVTFSCYLKKAERSFAVVRFGTNGFANGFTAVFNLDTGVVSNTYNVVSDPGGTSATISSVGDGWYRVTVSATNATGTVKVQVGPNSTGGGGQLPQYAGTAGSGIFIWGAQLDLGTTATPYQRITDGVQDYFVYGSALPTLYQDSAGTTPVTAVEQPVGLMLDKSRGLVLGSELRATGTTSLVGSATAATYNTSTGVGTFTRVDASNQSSVVFSGLTSTKTYRILITNAGAATVAVRSASAVGTVIGAAASGATLTVYASGATSYFIACGDASGSATFTVQSIAELPGLHATQATALSRPVLSSRYNLLLNTETLSTQNVTTVAVSYTLSFTGTGTITLSGTSTAGPLVGTGASNRVSLTFTPTAGTLTLTVSGSVTQAQLITTNSFTSNTYQRVTTATDYDADFTKFPPYLRCDGVDDGMATASIDFTSTDKMTIFTGVCKQSDASATILYELTANYATSNGTFAVFAPGSGGNPDISFASRGTATSARSSTATPAGTNYVLTHVSDIAADRLAPRVNGVALTPSVADQGTGTFGNYPLYLFRRGGTTLPFNGRFYGLTIIGAAISDFETSVLERFTASKTGITL